MLYDQCGGIIAVRRRRERPRYSRRAFSRGKTRGGKIGGGGYDRATTGDAIKSSPCVMTDRPLGGGSLEVVVVLSPDRRDGFRSESIRNNRSVLRPPHSPLRYGRSFEREIRSRNTPFTLPPTNTRVHNGFLIIFSLENLSLGL